MARLERAIYWCLVLFTAALLHSKAVTEIAYSAALLLWSLRLMIRHEKRERVPIFWGLLGFLVLSALSSMFSLEPALSWERMKSVALLVIAPLFAYNVRTVRQIRTLISVLLISGLASVAYVGWSYLYGIGARLSVVPLGTALYAAGARPGDIVISVNGRRTRTPAAFVNAVRHAPAGLMMGAPLKSTLSLSGNQVDDPDNVRLVLNREELWKLNVVIGRQALLDSGVLNPGALGRGRPPRATGGLGYSVTYAEVMLQVALLAFGLLVSAAQRQKRMQLQSNERPGARQLTGCLLACFVLFCIALGATLTRASQISLLAGGLLIVWVSVPRVRWRTLSIVAVLAGILLVSFWVRRERRIGLLGRRDAGTQYRVLMWKDGVRLARQHPWFGVGMDTIKARWRQLDIRAYRLYPIQSHFHSTPIQLAAERGLLTLALWTGLMTAYLAFLFRLLRVLPLRDWFNHGLAMGILGAASGFLCSGMVHYNLGDSEVQMLFWCFMGLAVALGRNAAQISKPENATGAASS